jgi:hypothetical protein
MWRHHSDQDKIVTKSSQKSNCEHSGVFNDVNATSLMTTSLLVQRDELEHHQCIDRSKTSSRVSERQRIQASKGRHKDLIRSSHPQRMLHLHWGSHKGRAITKSLFPLPTPTKEDWCSLRILHQGEGNTNDLGCTTPRGHSTGDA